MCTIRQVSASPDGVDEILRLFRTRGALTRAQVIDATGLSRTALNQRIDTLTGAGLLVGSQGEVPTKGRPADRFHFNSTRGVVLVCDIGASEMRAGLSDLDGRVRREVTKVMDVAEGPDAVLSTVQRLFEGLLAEDRCEVDRLLGIGLGVPGPVKFPTNQVINPPIMPGWDRFDLSGWFAERYDCPLFVEKDANAIAYGEYRVKFPHAQQLMSMKVGHGIGGGLVLDGRLYRGADGGAGDVGHNHYGGDDDGPLCKCGNVGCVEAVAGGWALMRDLQLAGHPITTLNEAMELLKNGQPDAVRLIRQAGRVLGAALAGPVNLINPRVVVIGGQLAAAGGAHLFAGVREMIYSRSLPLATAQIQIVQSSLHPRSGVLGLALLIGDSLFSGTPLDQLLNSSRTGPVAVG